MTCKPVTDLSVKNSLTVNWQKRPITEALPTEALDYILQYLGETNQKIVARVSWHLHALVEKRREIEINQYTHAMEGLITFFLKNINVWVFSGHCTFAEPDTQKLKKPYAVFSENLQMIACLLRQKCLNHLYYIKYFSGTVKRPFYNNQDSILGYLASELERFTSWDVLLKCQNAPKDLLNALYQKKIELEKLDERIKKQDNDIQDVFKQYIEKGFYWRVFYLLTASDPRYDFLNDTPVSASVYARVVMDLSTKDYRLVQAFCDHISEPILRANLLYTAFTMFIKKANKKIAFDFGEQFLNVMDELQEPDSHMVGLGCSAALFIHRCRRDGGDMLEITFQHAKKVWDKTTAISNFEKMANDFKANDPQASAEFQHYADKLKENAHTALGRLKKTLSVAKRIFWD